MPIVVKPYSEAVMDQRSTQEISQRAQERAREMQKQLTHPRLVSEVVVYVTNDLLPKVTDIEASLRRIVRKALRQREIMICDTEIQLQILPAREEFKNHFVINFKKERLWGRSK